MTPPAYLKKKGMVFKLCQAQIYMKFYMLNERRLSIIKNMQTAPTMKPKKPEKKKKEYLLCRQKLQPTLHKAHISLQIGLLGTKASAADQYKPCSWMNP